MNELQTSVFQEFEDKDKKLAKQQKRIRRARFVLILICFWSAYVSVLVLLGNKIAYVHPAYILCYIITYFLSKRWPGLSLFIATTLWAWNVFISCFERFVILTTAYYRDYSMEHWGTSVYLSFTLEVILKLLALAALLIGVIAAIRHHLIVHSPLLSSK